MEIIEDRNGITHIINREEDDFYRAECIQEIPEGRYYNGEFKGFEERDKESLEIQEVENIEEIEGTLCDKCRIRVSEDDKLFQGTDIPPAKYPLFDNTAENVEINRTGKPSRLEKRLARVGIGKLREFAERKGLNEDLYEIHVDAEGGHLCVILRIKNRDTMLKRKELNKTFQEIQETHNYPNDIGDLSIHSGYNDDDYYSVVMYSWDKKTFETDFYREYGRKPKFCDYDDQSRKGMYAARVVFN